MKIDKLACPTCGAPISGDFAPNQPFECKSCGSTLYLADFKASDIILCPQCRTPNHETVRFCTHCGGPLRVDCVLCYTSNRIDVTFCANCGAHLERARQKRDAMQDAKRRRQAEQQAALQEKELQQSQERLQRLIEALDEPENHDFAIFQLNQIGEGAVEALTRTLLTDDDVDARYGSARALGQIASLHKIDGLNKARAVKSLMGGLADSDPAVRYWAAEALGRYRSPLAVEPLGALLKDPHAGVRDQARRSLEHIGGERAQELLNRRSGLLEWFKRG